MPPPLPSLDAAPRLSPTIIGVDRATANSLECTGNAGAGRGCAAAAPAVASATATAAPPAPAAAVLHHRRLATPAAVVVLVAVAGGRLAAVRGPSSTGSHFRAEGPVSLRATAVRRAASDEDARASQPNATHGGGFETSGSDAVFRSFRNRAARVARSGGDAMAGAAATARASAHRRLQRSASAAARKASGVGGSFGSLASGSGDDDTLQWRRIARRGADERGARLRWLAKLRDAGLAVVRFVITGHVTMSSLNKKEVTVEWLRAGLTVVSIALIGLACELCDPTTGPALAALGLGLVALGVVLGFEVGDLSSSYSRSIEQTMARRAIL